MFLRILTVAFCVGSSSGAASPQNWDMTGYHPQPGLEVSSQEGSLSVRWDGEKGQELLVKWSAPRKLVQPKWESLGRVTPGGTHEQAKERRRGRAITP